MSTRSIIVLTGAAETIRLYKHSDGYPTGNLPVILEAIENGQRLTKEHAERFKENPKLISVDTLCGLIIGAATSVYGMGARIDSYDDDEAVYQEHFEPKHLGNQSDLEWIYLINLDNQTLSIFGGGYTGEVPQVAFKNGEVDPVSYTKKLYPEYQDREAKETRELVSKIEALGFKVNPNSKTKRSKVVPMKRNVGAS